ncbi:MAG: NADH-quinone oxidoreductase subunit NuoH [Deferribacterota bacterium]|nr:NADH-quinone oxidoreductase subunit NuoH [Deferribacterota bacterium]
MIVTTIILLVKILVIVTIVLLAVAYLTYAERKVVGHMQARLGPTHVGWKGLLQPIADAVKLIAKEDIVPSMVDRPVYIIAPIISMTCVLAAFAVIPFSDTITVLGYTIHPYIADLNIGILYILALSSVGTYGIIMAGWASNSKYALLASLRTSAQMISYETALGLSLIGPLLLAGSLNMKEIVLAQEHLWFIVPQILAFVIFLLAALAETNRIPFDLLEAEQELVAGFVIEYASMKFALFFLAEYAHMILAACIATVLFLGGWYGPFLPGILWFFIKVLFIIFIYLWLESTLPRLRFDQLMVFGWKVLIPLALVNIVITSIVMYII